MATVSGTAGEAAAKHMGLPSAICIAMGIYTPQSSAQILEYREGDRRIESSRGASRLL
jgi:hypothetical protein